MTDIPRLVISSQPIVLRVGGVTGKVFGPASSTDNAVVRFDGTSGKTLQSSTVIIDDSDNISGVTTLAMDDGTESLPSLYWSTGSSDTGFYAIGADNVGFSAGGSKVLDIDSTGLGITGTLSATALSATTVSATGQFKSANGTVGAPGYAFTNETDCGLYYIGANNIGFACNGAKVLDIGTTGLGVTGAITATGNVAGVNVAASGLLKSADGAVGAPGVTFTSDTDCGLYRIGADNIGVAVNGSKILDVATTGLSVAGTVTPSTAFRAPDGSAGAPSYSFSDDTDSGLYRTGANAIFLGVNSGGKGLAITGTKLSTTGALDVQYELKAGDGAVGLPSLGFTADTNTGLYRIGADNIGVSCGGSKVLDVATTGMAVTGLTSTSGGLVTGNTALAGSERLRVDGGSTPGTAASDEFLVGDGDVDMGGNIVLGGKVQAIAASASDLAYTASVTGDSVDRFATQADGEISWGSGSAAADTNLYRSSASVLKTDSSLVIGGPSLNFANASTADITRSVDNAYIAVYGGSDYQSGAGLVLYGDSNASNADEIVFTRGSAVQSGVITSAGELQWDGSVSVGGSALTLADATDIVVNTSTGTKIGTSTSQKLGFWDATPVVQPSHIADATSSHSITDPSDGPADADALRDDLVATTIPSIEAALDALGSKINTILANIIEATGLSAAS